jgi:hypothetical protein
MRLMAEFRRRSNFGCLENAFNGGVSEAVKLWVSGKYVFGGGQTLGVWKMRWKMCFWVSGKCVFGCLENAFLENALSGKCVWKMRY